MMSEEKRANWGTIYTRAEAARKAAVSWVAAAVARSKEYDTAARPKPTPPANGGRQ